MQSPRHVTNPWCCLVGKQAGPGTSQTPRRPSATDQSPAAGDLKLVQVLNTTRNSSSRQKLYLIVDAHTACEGIGNALHGPRGGGANQCRQSQHRLTSVGMKWPGCSQGAATQQHATSGSGLASDWHAILGWDKPHEHTPTAEKGEPCEVLDRSWVC